MDLLLFCASLRKDSLNKKLLAVAESILGQNPDNHVLVADLKSLSIPIYDGDVEKENFPEGVKRLGEMVKLADGLVIATPEYNGFISSPLKNTIDWLSRLKPVPLEKKPVLLMGASPGYFGTMRSLMTTRTPFDILGGYVYPTPFALSKADQAFSLNGDLSDPTQKERLTKLLQGYREYVGKFSNRDSQ